MEAGTLPKGSEPQLHVAGFGKSRMFSEATLHARGSTEIQIGVLKTSRPHSPITPRHTVFDTFEELLQLSSSSSSLSSGLSVLAFLLEAVDAASDFRFVPADGSLCSGFWPVTSSSLPSRSN